MLKAYYYTAADYNGVLITDGAKAWDVPEFPQDGNIEEARNADLSGVEGCETVEEAKQSIGTEISFFRFCAKRLRHGRGNQGILMTDETNKRESVFYAW